MKKFLKVRNIVIILIIIAAIFVVAWVRRSNAYDSKTYEYLRNIELKDRYKILF